jgi:hypothetical protein
MAYFVRYDGNVRTKEDKVESLAKYCELLPDAGHIISYGDKSYEIQTLTTMSEMSGISVYRWTVATLVEIDDEANDVGNEPISVILDQIDYKIV